MASLAASFTVMLSMICGVSAAHAQSGSTPPAPSQPATQPPAVDKPADKAPEKKALTAKERLAASAKFYSELKTYRDEGTLTQEIDAQGQNIKRSMPFTTAFERTGRFRWEFRHSATPGAKPDQAYTVWSADGKSFDSYWTLTKEVESGLEQSMAFAGPTGISGGLTMEIIPLLKIGREANKDKPEVVAESGATDLTDPADKGTEKVDGVECFKVEGARRLIGDRVTLWIDAEGLIRKIDRDTVVDPSKLPDDAPKMPKFSVRTTITFKPVINEKKIDDASFAPPAAAKAKPKGE